MEDFDMEPLADEAVNDMHSFIDIEKRFVQEEHNLALKVEQLELVFGHLDESLPEGHSAHKILGDVIDIFLEIRDEIEEERLKDLNIVREEEAFLSHGDWRAVKSVEEKAIRLEEHELKFLHKSFSKAVRLLKKLVRGAHKNKEEYEDKAEYYFSSLYRFSHTYERILEDLLEKERKIKEK